MRDWRKYWRNRERIPDDSPEHALRQVGHTLLGSPIGPDQVRLITESIQRSLELTASDQVVDFGCGNGFFTREISKLVARIHGVDASQVLIDTAEAYFKTSNCTYSFGDIARDDTLRSLPFKPAKSYSYGVFQHLSAGEADGMLRTMQELCGEGFLLFAAHIPDKDRIQAFYNTPERWRLYEDSLKSNTEQMGHWWRKEELIQVCVGLGLHCQVMLQDANLETSRYRFNALIRGGER